MNIRARNHQHKTDVCKMRPKSFKHTLEKCLDDYCINTTIHGLKYVGMKELSTSERCFFGISFIFVVCLSTYFITNVYMKWVHTPMIIALNPELSSNKDYPFPAITICNMNQARNSFAKNIKRETLEYSMLSSLCQHAKVTPNINRSIFGRWASVQKFVISASQPCKEMIQHCKFAGTVQDCSKLISTIITDEGLCCTFNSLDPAYLFRSESSTALNNYSWTPERGYAPQVNFKARPRRIPGAGMHMGLSVVLYANIEEYFCSSTNSYGFKVLVHNPVETPKISSYGFFVAAGEEVQVAVTPSMYFATEPVKKISTQVRQCLFEDESKLEFYSVYTKLNCEMECEARMTDENCGCIQMYMPKVNEDSRICDQRDATCFESIRYKIDYFGDESFMCDCLPACYEIGYTKELATATLGDGSFIIENEIVQQNDSDANYRKNIAVLHIFLKDGAFRAYTKTEFIGFTEFLSNTGGLLGLFLGFSVLSLVEFIYFISLRPYMTNKRNKPIQDNMNTKPKKGINIISKNKVGNVASKKSMDLFYIKFPPTTARPNKIITPFCN